MSLMDTEITNGIRPPEVESTVTLVDHVILEDYPQAMDYSPYRQSTTTDVVTHLFLYKIDGDDFVIKVSGDRQLQTPPPEITEEIRSKYEAFKNARATNTQANHGLSQYSQGLVGSPQQQDRVLRAVTRTAGEIDNITISDPVVADQAYLLSKYYRIKEIQNDSKGSDDEQAQAPNGAEDPRQKNGKGRELLKRFFR